MSDFWIKQLQLSTAAAVAGPPEPCNARATPTSCSGGVCSPQEQQQQMPARSSPLVAQSCLPSQSQLAKSFPMAMGLGLGVGMPVGVGVLGGPGAGLHHPPLGLCGKPKKMRKPRTSTFTGLDHRFHTNIIVHTYRIG